MPPLRSSGSLATSAMLLAAMPLTVLLQAGEADVAWSWAGGVTATRAAFVAKISSAAPLSLAEGTWSGTRTTLPATPPDADGIARWRAAGLKPNTAYAWGVAGAAKPLGTLRTHPEPGKPASFTIALASCAKKPDGEVFRAIAKQQALVFLCTGDLHYGDLGARGSPATFLEQIGARAASPDFSKVFAAMSWVYMWDDHDFTGNDASHSTPGAEAAHAAYRRLIPHHDLALPGARTPIAQAFTVGRVRFVIPDLRSQRDAVAGSLLGAAQKPWIESEISAAARTCKLLVLVSSVPWNGKAQAGSDRWQSYDQERAWLAQRIKAAGIRACVLSGDAHMSAIDDGTNSDFAGGWPMPVFQAGPLTSGGSYKGGPYSHGASLASGQFGMMTVTDAGAALSVRWEARVGSDGIGSEIVTARRDAKGGKIAYEFTVK